MSRFYTNIEVRGNKILYMGWDGNMPIKQEIKYRPHLFIDSQEQTKHVSFTNQGYVQRIDFDTIKDMKDYVKTYSEISNFNIYGCTDVVRQFTAEHFRGEIQWDYKRTNIWFGDIETRVEGIVLEDPLELVQTRLEGVESDSSYSDLMSLLDSDTSFEVFDDGEWVNIKKASIYRAGFPKPELAEQEILLISLVEHHSKKLFVWSTKAISKDNPIYSMDGFTVDYRVFPSEKEMLKDFMFFWKTNRVDVFSGWNSEPFDMPYLVNRLTKVLGREIAEHLSPWGVIKERKFINESNKEILTFDIMGVTHLDYLEIYKKFNPGSKESFKLDYIAEYELGKKKVENPTDNFRDFYLKHWDTFSFYNAIDTVLLHELETKMLQVRLAMQIAFIAKCNFGDVVSAMRVWESIIYNYFIDIGIVEDAEKPRNSKHQIVGAYVHEPKPGKRGWTVSIDATSLYPSIMMQNNISPECIIGMRHGFFVDNCVRGDHVGEVEEGTILSANGLITNKNQMGFIPILVKRMFDLRKETKNNMLDLKKKNAPEEQYRALDVAQQAFKVNANSFYGIMGLPYFRYYDYRMAEAVTATGQVFIKKTKEYVDEIFTKIMGVKKEYAYYLDTDSAYIDVNSLVEKYCKGKTDQEIVTFIEKFITDVVQPQLNKKLSVIAKDMGIDDCKISFKLECIGPSAIFVAKKKYMFDILYSEGVRYDKPKMKVMGIEIVRSSTPSVVKDYLKECATLCLRGTESELQKYVIDVKSNFMKLDYRQASFPRGCNGLLTYASDHSIYGSKTPIQTRGALLYNHYLKESGLEAKYPLIADGDKVKFIMLKKKNPIHEDVISFPASLPSELNLTQYIDWETQFNKAFLVPLTSILTAIGWNAKEQPPALDE